MVFYNCTSPHQDLPIHRFPGIKVFELYSGEKYVTDGQSDGHRTNKAAIICSSLGV